MPPVVPSQRLTRLLLFLGFFLVCRHAAAQFGEDRVTEHVLKNGMRFLIVERHQAPTFSAVIAFKVGGVDEKTGETGIAHMFEHMAFKGTRAVGTRNYRREKALLDKADAVAEELSRLKAVGKADDDPAVQDLRRRLEELQRQAAKWVVPNEFDRILSVNGADDLNAWTSKDMTAYVVSLPANRLELWALLESQRIATPVLREFYAERDVIFEERLQSVENSPFGKLYEALCAAAFTAHPYRVPTIGWASDIASLTRPQAERFRKTYYTPGNAVCAIVGDVNPKDAIPILEKYFGAIPAGPPPPPVVTSEPEQVGERRVNVEHQAQPHVLIAFHKPTLPSDDDFVFDVIDAILTEGRTSRLYTALVKELKIAASVASWTSEPGVRYPNLFVISAQPIHPHTTEELETAIYKELDRLKTELVPEQELAKVKNLLDAQFVHNLESNLELAEQLAFYQITAGDWRYMLRWRERVRKAAAEDIQRVAQKYLVARNRTVATLVPARSEETEQ